VAGQHADSAELQLIPSLYASEDAEEQVVELRAGAEEIAPLDGPAGDEDEGR
jgi:hypothetical protein